MSGEIKASLFVDAGPRPPVRQTVRGPWGCQCGAIRNWECPASEFVTSLDAECRYCGDSARLLPAEAQ